MQKWCYFLLKCLIKFTSEVFLGLVLSLWERFLSSVEFSEQILDHSYYLSLQNQMTSSLCQRSVTPPMVDDFWSCVKGKSMAQMGLLPCGSQSLPYTHAEPRVQMAFSMYCCSIFKSRQALNNWTTEEASLVFFMSFLWEPMKKSWQMGVNFPSVWVPSYSKLSHQYTLGF